MEKIRIGHVGTLHDHSAGKLACVKKFPDVFEVVGIVPEDDARWEHIKNQPAYRGIPRMTEEELCAAGVDAVMVEGFEHELPHVALRFVKRGVHVHVDKPAGRDLDVFRETLRTAKQKGLAVQIAYMYRYNPAYLDCLRLAEEGRLGEIYQVTAIMNVGHTPEKRAWLSQFDGGMMFYLGCHMVDFVYRFLGMPKSVHPFIKSSGLCGVDAPDNATAILEYEHGASIVQSVASEIGGFSRRQLTVCGSRGSYTIHPLERPLHAYLTDGETAKPFADTKVERTFPPFDDVLGRYDDMMLDFAAMVRGEKENPYSYEYEWNLQKLVLACCGRDVDLDEPLL
ncbi:MAG: Gfo/Idh/MocA family oxidoreductase [Clostridia bacterium]|nr:Gfo/Idh/MocA family oxidoreductase [Clostridia bacterium]